MIGVIAEPKQYDVVREFFELFKTPWEFYRQNHHYEVLISSGQTYPESGAKLVVVYAGRKLELDDNTGMPVRSHQTYPRVLSYQGDRIPIYQESASFENASAALLTDEKSRECAGYLFYLNGETTRVRIGYDLFAEIETLLTVGQPPANASIPTLELHIALLRNLIIGAGVSLVEIPPIPDGFQFIACLTHDVDHPAIRQHKWDHTIGGFLFRASIGALIDVLRRRLSIRDAVKNCAAALKLPFVYIGIAEDFWRDFDDRYLRIEQNLPSTFFVIPFRDYPGKSIDGSAPAFRAARYKAKDIAESIQKLTKTGHEVGVHGIDAWLDSAAGFRELEEIRRLAGSDDIGVRMHWLYWDENSPAALERAGAVYDSTVGYNQTVGYRAGTMQAYRPFGVERLLELPLHAMDTALFYPSYLRLSQCQATARLQHMSDVAVRYGGCFTINWHDRSLAPERLWERCYRDLIEDLKDRGVWFATAAQAVSWFRKRRSAMFEADLAESGSVRVRMAGDHDENLPGLRLRVHKSQESASSRIQLLGDYVDTRVNERFGFVGVTTRH